MTEYCKLQISNCKLAMSAPAPVFQFDFCNFQFSIFNLLSGSIETCGLPRLCLTASRLATIVLLQFEVDRERVRLWLLRPSSFLHASDRPVSQPRFSPLIPANHWSS